MISLAELNPENIALDEEQTRNIQLLFVAMNAVRSAYNVPMIVTSGVRTPSDQSRIDPAHPQSCHVAAAACDIADSDRKLWEWCIDNLPLICRLGLYLEDKRLTPKHVHFQILAPDSGKRIFLP